MNVIESFIIILMAIIMGFVCRRINIFDSKHLEGFEIFLFKITMPCYLFNVTFNSEFIKILNLDYIYSYLITFFIIAFIIRIYFYNKDFSIICMRILASSYVNAAIYSLSVITLLLGSPKAGIIGNIIQVILIQPIFIIYFSLIRHREKRLFKILIKVFSNPIIIMPIMGLLLGHLEFHLSLPLETLIKNLGKGASSLALFTFGLVLGEAKIKKENLTKDLISIIIIKTIFHPIIAYLVGRYIFKLEEYWLFSLVIFASAPTAFVVYIIAKQFYIEETLMKNVIVVSAAFSLVSLFIIILLIL